ncbi:hypothetical protein tb265_06450 [Gemmatimonadetes bacterium T265]|nr:hypothetical protein tb265_06450 [Gemmatimonadetes bacterium T265]
MARAAVSRGTSSALARRTAVPARPGTLPMVNTALRSDATLAEWLAARAQAVTPRRLALDLLGGGLAVGAAALWRPRGWPALLAVGLCFVAFGAWAVAERQVAERAAAAPLAPREAVGPWRTVRALAAVVGTLAAGLLGVVLLFGVLGTWIS